MCIIYLRSGPHTYGRPWAGTACHCCKALIWRLSSTTTSGRNGVKQAWASEAGKSLPGCPFYCIFPRAIVSHTGSSAGSPARSVRSFVPWGPYRTSSLSRHTSRSQRHSHFPLAPSPLHTYISALPESHKERRALTQRIQWQPILIYSIFIEVEQKIPGHEAASNSFLVLLSQSLCFLGGFDGKSLAGSGSWVSTRKLRLYIQR